MKNYIFPTPKETKTIPTKSPNGFVELFGLVCMGIVLEVVALMSVVFVSNAQLVLSQRQSTMDLSCISVVKGMIAHNEWVQRCNLDPSQKKSQVQKNMQGIDVRFVDCDSYILCTYEKQEKWIEMKVYYSYDLISGMDIDSH